ncbi:hypothetical protein PG991_014680 [Apiospora marii]|uniref:Sulfatase-modifying factor enzyme-like domain-containing protein n=1 Tax=Apiospora marii TaxID=335849 RepID=A0ABR1R543_9PEZI
MGSISRHNPYAFPLTVKDYASTPVPSMEEWETMWKAWDMVTTQIIPADALMEQPIPLRNPLKFYVGHIPTLRELICKYSNSEDIHLSRATGTPLTQPASYAEFFERGIDPDVEDPTQCHDHSELPTVWPELSEMLEYREKVKRRIKLQYDTGRAYRDRTIGRALWIGYEHEESNRHQTYRVQISRGWRERRLQKGVENQWFRVPEQGLTIGYEDPESDDGSDRYFAWDNEREPYDVKIPAFEAQARPVSVGEYAAFLVDSGKTDTIPATWVKLNTRADNAKDNEDDNDEPDDIPRIHNAVDTALQEFLEHHGIRTVWGPIPYPKHEWVGGGVRVPTLHEVRSIHEYAAQLSTNTINSSPSNPTNSKNKTMHTDPESIFADLSGANVGLQNFHPVPITHRGDRLCGLGDLGGAWEWTSTVFAPQPGFKPMDIYPGYSGKCTYLRSPQNIDAR